MLLTAARWQEFVTGHRYAMSRCANRRWTNTLNSRLSSVARLVMIVIATLVYGWLAYRASNQIGPSIVAAALGFAPLLFLAIWLAWRSPWRPFLFGLLTIGALLTWQHADWLLRHYHWTYLIQHAGAMVLLGLMFGRTLLPGQEPLVTRFARHAHHAISPLLASYTRKVTWAWTLFFAVMAINSLALYAAAPIRVWALFANGLTPLLVFVVFAAEYLVRLRALPVQDRVGPIQAVMAYVRYCAQAAATPQAPDNAIDGNIRQ